MHVRWWFTITYGGREVKYFAGRINWLGDGLSRNPEDREEAQRLLKLVDTDPKSVLKLFTREAYEDLEVAEEAHAWSQWPLRLDRSRPLCPCLEGGEWALVGGEPQQVMRVLCLPGLDASRSPGLSGHLSRKLCTDGTPVQWKVEVVDPPNKDESFMSFWMSSRKRMPEARGKELKTQIMNHIVFVLRLLVEKNAEVVVGLGQGGVVLFGVDGFVVCLEILRDTFIEFTLKTSLFENPEDKFI